MLIKLLLLPNVTNEDELLVPSRHKERSSIALTIEIEENEHKDGVGARRRTVEERGRRPDQGRVGLRVFNNTAEPAGPSSGMPASKSTFFRGETLASSGAHFQAP